MIKLGFSTLGCPAYSVDQIIALAKDNGYAGVELRFVGGEVRLETLDEFSPSGIADTRRKFEQAGVEVVCVDSSVRFTSPDADERAKQHADARTYTRIAAELGAPYVRVFGGPVPPDQDERETAKLVAEGLAQAADESVQSGVQLLLETHDTYSTGVHVQELLSYASSEHLGILWDYLHSLRAGEPPEDTYRLLGDRIRHVHLKDSAVFSPSGFDLVLTGTGNVGIEEFTAFLRRVGYNGYVNFEWEKAWLPAIEEPEVAIPHFAEYMRKLI